MDDFYWQLIGMLGSFFVGTTIIFVVMRGFITHYLKSLRGDNVLLRVHRKDGRSPIWRCAEKQESGAFKYSIGKKKYIVSPVEGSVFRCIRTNMCDVEEEDSAPFIFKKFIPVSERTSFLNDKGEKEEREVIKYKIFEGYNDSSLIDNIILWALARPKRKLAGIPMDSKTILFLVIGAVAVIYLVMSMNGGGSII